MGDIPLGLAARGARLWTSLLTQDVELVDEANPAREVALSACMTADRVDYLENLASSLDPVVEGRTGPMIHPVYAEVRQQAQLLARLVAALRLPDDATGKRPRSRPGPAGVKQPTKVTSLEKARAARSS